MVLVPISIAIIKVDKVPEVLELGKVAIGEGPITLVLALAIRAVLVTARAVEGAEDLADAVTVVAETVVVVDGDGAEVVLASQGLKMELEHPRPRRLPVPLPRHLPQLPPKRPEHVECAGCRTGFYGSPDFSEEPCLTMESKQLDLRGTGIVLG